MGRHRRESPIGRLRLKYPKKGYDKNKLYTLYYEYTWLANEVVRKDTQVRTRVDDWNEKGNMGKGELRASFGNDYKRINSMLKDKLLKYDATLLEYVKNTLTECARRLYIQSCTMPHSLVKMRVRISWNMCLVA